MKLDPKKIVKEIRGNDFVLGYSDILLEILMDAIEGKDISKERIETLSTIMTLGERV